MTKCSGNIPEFMNGLSFENIMVFTLHWHDYLVELNHIVYYTLRARDVT